MLKAFQISSEVLLLLLVLGPSDCLRCYKCDSTSTTDCIINRNSAVEVSNKLYTPLLYSA